MFNELIAQLNTNAPAMTIGALIVIAAAALSNQKPRLKTTIYAVGGLGLGLEIVRSMYLTQLSQMSFMFWIIVQMVWVVTLTPIMERRDTYAPEWRKFIIWGVSGIAAAHLFHFLFPGWPLR